MKNPFTGFLIIGLQVLNATDLQGSDFNADAKCPIMRWVHTGRGMGNTRDAGVVEGGWQAG
jgi:hypothetical protein